MNDNITISNSTTSTSALSLPASPYTSSTYTYTATPRQPCHFYRAQPMILQVDSYGNWKIITEDQKNEEPPKMQKKSDYIPHIEKIEILNPNKVLRFTFSNKKQIKTICDNVDDFNFEYACFLAYAKLLYKDEYTFEGILYKADELRYQKRFVKLVNEGIKKFNKDEEEKFKKELEALEVKEIKKRRREKQILKRNKHKKANG